MSDELPDTQGSDISYESARHGAKVKVVIRCTSADAWTVQWCRTGDDHWVLAGELVTHDGGYVAENRNDRWKGRSWRELTDMLVAS